jgi:hypothetical protein
MKAIILAAAVLISATLNAQNLKDLLYGGKLKSDTGSTVRKSDDLSTKIDTLAYQKAVEARRVQEETTKKELIASGVDSVQATIIATGGDTLVTAPGTPPTPKDVKENNARWKFYIDELVGALRTEVMPNKKIKEGSYAVLVEYEIGEDGAVRVVTVSSDPANSFLENQIKDRITYNAPKLAPIIANGKPRKIIRKQLISLSK